MTPTYQVLLVGVLGSNLILSLYSYLAAASCEKKLNTIMKWMEEEDEA